MTQPPTAQDTPAGTGAGEPEVTKQMADVLAAFARNALFYKPDMPHCEMVSIPFDYLRAALVVCEKAGILPKLPDHIGAEEDHEALTAAREAHRAYHNGIAGRATPPPAPERTTHSGRLPEQLDDGAPAPIDPKTGMHKDYWILSAEEREKGFVRPVRRTYQHLNCGTVTTMATAIAETYARDPSFYGLTFCCGCRSHLPVAEFVWDGTNERVGS